jgi:hypothetical protein
MYNGLEERITDLENVDGSIPNVDKRLSVVEDRLKPYQQYEQQAVAAVQQLTDFQERFSSAKPPKVDEKVSKLVHDLEASRRDHAKRLFQLENQVELAKAQTMSTRDLARALIQRMNRGDVLDQGTTHELRHLLDTSSGATPSAAMIPRLPGTPVTEEAPDEEQEVSPKKRRLMEQTTTTKTSASKTDSEKYTTPEVNDALSAFRKGELSETTPEDSGGKNGTGTPSIPPERKSARKSNPPKRSENMIHWKQANTRMRGAR